MNWTHVHIGAGKFGLGMVVDLCNQAGFVSAVLNKANTRKHHPMLKQARCYQIIYDEGKQQSRTVPVDIHYYEDPTDPRAVELLASPSVRFLTTSVTPDGFKHIAPLLARAIEKRSTVADANTLCVMACENLSLNSEVLAHQVAASITSEAIKHFLRDRVVFCNTVVDRVCSDVHWDANGVEIQAESFHEWVVEKPPADIDAIRTLANFITLARNRSEFKAYEVRKYWCLNGLHLAAAAYAYQHTHFELLADALDLTEIRDIVHAVQEDLGFAFRCYAEEEGVAEIFPEDDVKAYNDLVLRRFISNRDERVARLLKHEGDIEGAVSAFAESVWKAVQREGLESAIRKNLMGVLGIFDLHQFLARVSERIVRPQRQILSFYQRSGSVPSRLALDDALQTITLALDRYTTTLFEQARVSIPRPRL